MNSTYLHFLKLLHDCEDALGSTKAVWLRIGVSQASYYQWKRLCVIPNRNKLLDKVEALHQALYPQGKLMAKYHKDKVERVPRKRGRPKKRRWGKTLVKWKERGYDDRGNPYPPLNKCEAPNI